MIERFCRTEYKDYNDFYHNYYVNVPRSFNFGYDVVDGWAAEQPDKTAIVWCNDAGDERILTFSEISQLSNRAANWFRKCGIAKGDAVMLTLKRRFEYWIAVVALHKLGAVAIPATYQLTEKDLVYRFTAANVRMIVTAHDESLLPHILTACEKVPAVHTRAVAGGIYPGFTDFNEYLNCSDVFERPTGENAIRNTDPMLMYFTSGTTGLPKMVVHDFTYPLGHIITGKFWQQLDEHSLHITVADTGWAKASWGKIYGQWIAGAAQFIYDMDKFVPHKLIEKICKYHVTSFCAPPTVYRFLIKEDLSSYDFSCLEHATTAGEALNPEVFRRFREQTGCEIKEGFGQTESTPLVATYPWVTPKPGSLGKASPLYGVKLLSASGEICDAGEEGEMVIDTRNGKPVGLFCGYGGDAGLTDNVWYDGYYHTGDIAWQDEKGYFYFVGRADDVIKSSGYRIGPFEVESALMEHPAVLECAISAVPDPVRGQIVKATIVLTKSYPASDELIHELQDHVKHTTAPYKYPRIVEFVDELPKTISGKIRRSEIRQQDVKKTR